MSTFGEKLRTLLKNNELTEKQFAEEMCVAETTVQKWGRDINVPHTTDLKKICERFMITMDQMMDDAYDVPDYIWLDRYLPYSCRRYLDQLDSEHDIYDAALVKEGVLHRYTNAGGDKCSAIYVAGQEIWWHYREHELRMLHDWNEVHSND